MPDTPEVGIGSVETHTQRAIKLRAPTVPLVGHHARAMPAMPEEGPGLVDLLTRLALKYTPVKPV